jgi:hypothetical protein
MADDIVSLSREGLKFGRSPANGELLIGNGSGFNMSTLTAGSGMTITNGAGSISIAAISGGTVNSGTANQLTYYAATGTAVSGNANATISTAALTLGVQSTTAGSLVLANTNAGAFPTTIKSSASAAAAWSLTLPVTAGTSTYVLSTDGTGVTSWVATGGGVTSLVAGTGIAVSAATGAVTVSAVTTLGAVGTYAYLASSSNASFTAGTTYAGSGLRYSGFQNNGYTTISNCSGISTSGGPEAPLGGTPSGTWQAMGTVAAGSKSTTATLFIRTV